MLIRPEPSPETLQEDDTKLVLVSFMRDYAFWKENAKRLVGLSSSFTVTSFTCFSFGFLYWVVRISTEKSWHVGS
jgi:elongator complex protein 6